MQSAFDLPLRAAPRYVVPCCFLGHRSKCSQCCCCSWFALRWVCLCSYTRGDLSLVKCLCCACGDVCSGPKQEIRYLEVENFWFGFRIRFRAELRIRFSLLKEFGNALCLCEVLTSLENQTVCVCLLIAVTSTGHFWNYKVRYFLLVDGWRCCFINIQLTDVKKKYFEFIFNS